jgi:hypothetical protein
LQGLQRRSDAAAARATLELMQEVAASTGKVEKLLSELSSGQQTAAGAGAASSTPASGAGAASESGAGGDELEERCRMLLRVAGEAARLMFLAERGKVRCGHGVVRCTCRRAGCWQQMHRVLALPSLLSLVAVPTKHEYSVEKGCCVRC